MAKTGNDIPVHGFRSKNTPLGAWEITDRLTRKQICAVGVSANLL